VNPSFLCEGGDSVKNIKLTLAYDGTNYHGFQIQQNAVTIQEELEKAIAKIFAQAVRVTAAGRTDAGVHALGQVVNFFVETKIPCERIPYALNSVLPADIVVTSAEEVPADFHARYSAKSKVYRYTVDHAPFPRVLTRHYAYHFPYRLDLDSMQRAASTLLGQKDFCTFMASGSSVKSTVRTIMALDLIDQDDYLTITIEADGFLYNMVRIITGTLLEVGLGKRHYDLTPVLEARNRSAAGWTAPAHGLIMQKVKY